MTGVQNNVQANSGETSQRYVAGSEVVAGCA